MGYDLSGTLGNPTEFDPTKSIHDGNDTPWMLPIYDSLLHLESDGSLTPGLALGAKINNSTTITVRLRPGLVFSNGTPLNSAAVKTTLLRNLATPNKSQFQPEFYDIKSVDTPSATTMVLHLSKPVAGAVYTLLAWPDTFVTLPGGNPSTDPIGAGPFMLKQYVPTQKIILVKNPRYWDAKDIHLSEIDVTSISPGPQEVNAINAGQVNWVAVPIPDMQQIQSDSSLRLYNPVVQSSNLRVVLCKTSAPLSNVAVRQALSTAVDRNAINEGALHGSGQPAWALWPQSNAYFPSALANYYAYNPAKAKQLLQQAGYPNGFSMTMIINPDPTGTQVAQILQSEWKAIGVNLKIDVSSNYAEDLFFHDGQSGLVEGGNAGLEAIADYIPPGIGDLCGYSNPQVTTDYAQLGALTPGSPQAVKLWDDAQTQIVDQAASILLDFKPTPFAATTSVANVNPVIYGPTVEPDFHTVSING
jgi:peptide/nickel transport system substrate-binding protein